MRQEQVRELVPLVAFRGDHLALCGALVARDPDARWEEATCSPDYISKLFSLARWVGFLGLLAAMNIVLMSLYALSLLPAWWSLSLALYLALYLSKHGEARHLFVEAYRLERALEHLRAVLLYLETHRYSGHRLAKLCAPFWRAARRSLARTPTDYPHCRGCRVQQSNLLGFLISLTGAVGPVFRPSAQPV